MKRPDIYYLIRALIASFSSQTDEGIISALNDYQISKEASRDVFKDEVKAKKPEYAVLKGFLILQNNFLRRHKESAFYEVLEVIEELRFCLKKDRRKTVRSLSANVILHLFISIYYEVIFIPPVPFDEELECVDKFTRIFPREDIAEIIKKDSFKTRYIFESHHIDLGRMQNAGVKINEILNQFYNHQK